MKRLQISTPNFVIKIQNFNIFTMIVLFFSAILLYYRERVHQIKEDAHMEDKKLIQLLSKLNKSYQNCKQGTADDIRLQELLNTTMQELKKTEQLNNSILIDLEKFYQPTSLLIGLGSLKLNDQARTAWRNYDKFHYDHVKHVLSLYGPVFEF